MAQIIVSGAGMVGVSTALALQARGHCVTLMDRRGPGEETSYGNAGFIQAEAAEPYAMPRNLQTLLAWAMGRGNDVRYSFGAVRAMAGPLWQYFRNSAPGPHHAASAIHAQLVQRARADHDPLIQACGKEALVRREGYYQIHRDATALAAATLAAGRLAQEYGITSDVLDTAALARAEPALRGALAGAILWRDCWTCSDPGALTAAYADLFVQRGGTWARGNALSLRAQGAGWAMDTDSGPIEAQHVVIALGPWSPDLLARLGYKTHMVHKRGYHGHFNSPAHLNRPLFDADNGIVISPMQRGLRLTTGAALVDRMSPAAPVQLARGAKAAAQLLDLGTRIEEPQWFGHRPCMPDMLPVVGPAPRHKNLWLNFGHGHQGFTLGPTTGALLADAFDGEANPLLTALAPSGRAVLH